MGEPAMAARLMVTALVMATVVVVMGASNSNNVYSPCADAKIQRSDGFTFGIAFAPRTSFFNGQVQLSPCDRQLSLTGSAQLAVFRPKVDEITLLTINTTSQFAPGLLPPFLWIWKTAPEEEVLLWRISRQQMGRRQDVDKGRRQPSPPAVVIPIRGKERSGGYMVAFAGRKYAARSVPNFVANDTYTITSFTLVLEFRKGTLQNLYWKRDGCASCSGKSNFVCLNKVDCGIKTSDCKHKGGSVDCSLGIQLAFSGTDKHLSVLNSWYEVSNLRQYSLYGLYSNLKDSLTSQYNSFF